MGVSRALFDELQQRWGNHSSWAVWKIEKPDEKPKAHVGDLDVLNPDLNSVLLGSSNSARLTPI